MKTQSANYRKVRVLYLTPAYKPSFTSLSRRGGEISNKILFDGLQERGHEVEVLSVRAVIRRGEYMDKVRVVEPFHWVPSGAVQLTLSMIFLKWFTKRRIRKIRPDLILASTELIPFAGRIGRECGIRAGAIVRAHENIPGANPLKRDLRGFLGRLVRWMTIGVSGGNELKHIDFIVTVSEFMRKRYESYLPGADIFVCCPPIEPPEFSRPTAETVRKVLMIGTSAEKGFEVFLELSRRFPGLDFVAVGDGQIENGESVSKGNLTRHGWISMTPDFYSDVDLVLVPSKSEEAFGRVSVEALFNGKFVLVSDRGGLPETVGHQSDLIVSADDIDDWTNRIARLVESPEQFKSAVDRARNYARVYSSRIQIAIFEETLQNASRANLG